MKHRKIKKDGQEFEFPTEEEKRKSEMYHHHATQLIQRHENGILHNGQAPDPEAWKERTSLEEGRIASSYTEQEEDPIGNEEAENDGIIDLFTGEQDDD